MPTAIEFNHVSRQYRLKPIVFNKVQKSFMDTV